MKTFEYKGLTTSGQSTRGLVEAVSVKAAREQLAGGGVLVERIAVAGRAMRWPAEARGTVYRELAALLAAGLPLVRALDMLIQSSRGQGSGALLAGVRDRVREGASLADALAASGRGLSGFEYAVLESGVRAGTLAGVLERLASFLEDQERLRERVQRALIYPAVVVAVGLCVALVMLGVLVPRTGRLLAESGKALPLLTRVMMGVSHVGLRAVPVLAVGVGMAIAYVRRRCRQDVTFRRRWDRALFRVPLWGRGYAQLVSLRFARTLALLLRGGVPLVEGISLAGLATGSAWVGQQAAEQAQAVRHGKRLSECLETISPLADLLPGWVRIGEESGDLAGLLEHAAGRCADRWDRYVSRALALLEPGLLLVVGVFVLLITLAVLLPVLSLTQTVSIR